MSTIDFILNFAGLLLWLNWRSVRIDLMSRLTPATLPGTLRRASPRVLKLWHFLVAIAALLVIRAFFYWVIGGPMNWVANLNLEITSIPFMSDFFGRMLLYSILSFGLMLGQFYLWLIFLVVVNREKEDPLQKIVRLTLGSPSKWENWQLLLVPSIIATVCWLVLSPLLARMDLLHSASILHRLGQGVLLGFGAMLTWKYLMGAILGLYLLNSYIYLGKHPIWNFVNLTARQMMSPLKKFPLEVGKVDFTPVLAIVLVFLLAHVIEDGIKIRRRDSNGLMTKETIILPSFPDFYRRISN
jgi:uncharacterized protein YggT (Ycf19 family)